jgi:myo-inositol-1(or 4)-monophosphatase
MVAPERPTELRLALVSTGFGYDPAIRTRQAEVAARVIPRARDIRRAGSAALDLCWCACGRLDAYYERGIRPWDYAAGALVCARAGLSIRHMAAVADGDGARADLPAGLLVAPPAFVEELEALVGEPSTTQTGEPPAIH